MNEKKRYRKWIIAVHLLFWVLLVALMVFVFASILSEPKRVMLATSVNLVGFLILVYVHLLYLLPRYFDQKRFLSYAVGLLILLIATATLRFFVGLGSVKAMHLDMEEIFTPFYFGSMFLTGTFFLLISIPLRLINNWFKKQELEKELKTHQLEAELRFLKAQVNPHFLFNALNNIYSLSFTESKKTPEMILKLSDMMSYMLYDCKSEQVKLTSEIEYLKNYIDLQQLKKDGELNIEFDINGNTSNVFITPMLFIPFFENAFKHGNLDDTENGWLKSKLSVENNTLEFKMCNTIKTGTIKKEKGGVGLENIRDRLKLLFPGKHDLDIAKENCIFSVNLKIDLSHGRIST